MLNSVRYHSIKALFTERNISLCDEDVLMYADMFEIIAQFVHGKLTDVEMMDAH